MNELSCHISVTDWEHAEPLAGPIRKTVFIDEQRVPPELEWDNLDACARHAVATEDSGHVIGCGRLLPSGQIGRMAVLTDYRKKGTGSTILHALENEARRLGYSTVFLHAQAQALPFYEQYGYHAYKDMFFEAGIPHLKCIKSL